MNNIILRLHLLFVFLGSIAWIPVGYGDVSLPPVIGSNMVLQRGMPVAIFGKADVGEKVAVTFGGMNRETTTGSDGTWKVMFDPMKANATGQTMTIQGKNTIELTNILIGEVWLGAGQSNMGWPVRHTSNPEEAYKKVGHPQIRLFNSHDTTTLGHVQKVEERSGIPKKHETSFTKRSWVSPEEVE